VVCSAGNPALVAASTRESGPRSRPTVTDFRISKMNRAFSWAFCHSAKAVWEALRVDGWGGHPVIDMEVGTVPIG